jgi:hypothetical protein
LIGFRAAWSWAPKPVMVGSELPLSM